jgi:signal transduction histidine kinase
MLSQIHADKLRTEGHVQALAAADIASLVQESLNTARDMAKNSYPVDIQTGGLLTALQGLADRISRTLKIDCVLECDEGRPFAPDPAEAIHFYRIAQEAVTNAVKHSGGTRIVIKCQSKGGLETLSVTDNGGGFQAPENPSGMGWHLMRYRARVIAAEVSVNASPTGGCVVTCRRKIRK